MNANTSAHDVELLSESVEQTMAIAERLGRLTQVGDVIGLVGDLGAGKTQFVRGLARSLGLDPRQVSSPTFVLMHEYEPCDTEALATQEQLTLVHIDAYRLGSPEELMTLGWDEDGGELRRQALVVLEWADIVQSMLGRDWLEVQLKHADKGTRQIMLQPHGQWRQRGLTSQMFAAH